MISEPGAERPREFIAANGSCGERARDSSPNVTSGTSLSYPSLSKPASQPALPCPASLDAAPLPGSGLARAGAAPRSAAPVLPALVGTSSEASSASEEGRRQLPGLRTAFPAVESLCDRGDVPQSAARSGPRLCQAQQSSSGGRVGRRGRSPLERRAPQPAPWRAPPVWQSGLPRGMREGGRQAGRQRERDPVAPAAPPPIRGVQLSVGLVSRGRPWAHPEGKGDPWGLLPVLERGDRGFPHPPLGSSPRAPPKGQHRRPL